MKPALDIGQYASFRLDRADLHSRQVDLRLVANDPTQRSDSGGILGNGTDAEQAKGYE
jgi:hypothetical protein